MLIKGAFSCIVCRHGAEMYLKQTHHTLRIQLAEISVVFTSLILCQSHALTLQLANHTSRGEFSIQKSLKSLVTAWLYYKNNLSLSAVCYLKLCMLGLKNF